MHLNELTNSEVKFAMDNTLRNLPYKTIQNNKSTTKIKVGSFSKYKDIKDSIFYTNLQLTHNVLPKFNKFDQRNDNSPIEKLNGIYVFFRQDYYTIKLNTAINNWKIFKKEIPDSTSKKDAPIYLNNITHGRYGLLIIESNNKTNIIKDIIQKSIDNFDSLSENEKEILAVSTIKSIYFGLEENWEFQPLLQSSLGQVEYFIKTLNTNEGKSTPPMFFELFQVNNNQQLKELNLTKEHVFTLK